MKKILLTTVALLSMASASVFGMYGVTTDWINFLTHGNQFRARLDQLGFTLGNDTIKGTFGFRNQSSYGGSIGDMLNTLDGKDYNFDPTISMGIGYTSSLIGIGVGYNATIGNKIYKFNGKAEGKPTQAVGHTPVLVLNAMDNAFRMAIPIQVYANNDKGDGWKRNITAVSVDSQFRYYTGIEALTQVRLFLRYGYYGWNSESAGEKDKGKVAESFGFDLRFYFGSLVEEVALTPFIKLVYNGALGKQHNQTRVEAIKVLDSAATMANNPTTPTSYGARWAASAWDLTLAPVLGLTANSDIVSLYVEPSLGLKITQDGSATEKNVKEKYDLFYGAYAEIYITPLKNLEWYFEADINNGGVSPNNVDFAATTGITWYLPAL